MEQDEKMLEIEISKKDLMKLCKVKLVSLKKCIYKFEEEVEQIKEDKETKKENHEFDSNYKQEDSFENLIEEVTDKVIKVGHELKYYSSFLEEEEEYIDPIITGVKVDPWNS